MNAVKTREQQIGIALVVIGALWLLTTLAGGDSGWLWIAALSALFLYFHRRQRNPGLAVPGGVLAGVAVGIVLESLLPFDGSAFLIGLAGGFYLVKVLEPRVHAWAVYPASILAAIAALVFVTQNALLIAVVLIGGGAWLLLRNARTKTAAVPPVPVDARRTALEKWRANLARLENKTMNEVLRTEQLELLLSRVPTTLEDLRGTLDDAQIARYGNQILEVLRSAS
jgi:hypothetical protein